MNIRALAGEAERAQTAGNAIYQRLLPVFKQQGLAEGLFVAINIETGNFVVAETRRELMSKYKQLFGRAAGWVRRIEYREDP